METTRARITADVMVVTSNRDQIDFGEELYNAVIGEGSLHVDVVEITKLTHESLQNPNNFSNT